MTATKHLNQMRWIAAPPALISTVSDEVNGFLASLPAPNFTNTPDTKALWAVVASHAEGTASVAGSAWVVSAETLKRVRAHRF